MSSRSARPLVLLIDDVADTRVPLAGLLRRRGYDVEEAASGEDGLRVLRAHPETGVIVLDLLMPEGDGWWFREHQLKEPAIAHVPVIVFSIAAKTEAVKYQLKASAILRKPTAVDELFAAIERCCGPGATGTGW